MEKNFNLDLSWKEIHLKLKNLKKGIRKRNMLPKRHCLSCKCCNLACSFCYQYRTVGKLLNSDDWIKIIDNYQTIENYRIGGEPLTLKNFENVFRSGKKHECNIICNGLLK